MKTNQTQNDPFLESRPRDRRWFVECLTAIASGIILMATPVAMGLAFLGSPLRRSARAGLGQEFIPLAISPEAIPDDGTPLLVTVQADTVDAWNRHPAQRLGTVWLTKRPDGSLLALSSICPHLGCAVDFRSAERDFFCPCHTSAFSLDGRRTNQIPPRDMDQLETRVRDNRIEVRYQRFRGAIPDKVAL